MALERSGSRDPETGRWKGETESTRWTTTTTLSCGDGRLAGAGGGERERRHQGGEAEPQRLEGDEDEAAPRGAAAAGKGNKWLGLGQRGAGPWGAAYIPRPQQLDPTVEGDLNQRSGSGVWARRAASGRGRYRAVPHAGPPCRGGGPGPVRRPCRAGPWNDGLRAVPGSCRVSVF
jgi:hypothetical protein